MTKALKEITRIWDQGATDDIKVPHHDHDALIGTYHKQWVDQTSYEQDITNDTEDIHMGDME